MTLMQTKYATYQITHDPIPDNEMTVLPLSVEKELGKIHIKMMKGKGGGKSSVKKLEELHHRFPEAKVIANFLSNAYKIYGDPKSEEFIYQVYKLYPDYLFARVEYADLCLKNGDIETAKDVFKEGFDLHLIYPDRDLFHVSEFLAISGFACHYFFKIGDHEKLHTLFKTMQKLAPEHPATKSVERHFIFPDILDALVDEVLKNPNYRKFFA
jgi:hypothetical protein